MPMINDAELLTANPLSIVNNTASNVVEALMDDGPFSGLNLPVLCP
jgi:hypothetical protein